MRLVFLFLLLLCTPLFAAEEWQHSHALAMHGMPKLDATFKAFDYVNDNAPKGGMLRLNITGTFDSLNPFIVKGKPAEGMTYVYESLMARSQDEAFTLYPLIAEKIDVRSDRLAIRFHINPRARWQDGKPLTADDVYFSWMTLKDKGRPNHRSYYKKVESAKVENAHAIVFSFKRNEDGSIDREMPLILGLMPVLPKHIWEKGGFDETSLAPPIGSGPYKVTALEAGRSTTFSRDPAYWGKDLPSRRGLFNFDTIRFDYYREENVAQEAFTAGQVDARRETEPKRWAELGRISQQKRGTGIFRTLTFTHQRPEPARGFIMNTRRTAFADVNVRRALLYAFDFNWINQALFSGAYKWINSTFANSELAASGIPDAKEKALFKGLEAELPADFFIKPYALPQTGGVVQLRNNLHAALDLFRSAGFHISNGIMHDSKGTPFGFEILLSDPQDEKVALEYARTLQRIGIAARVRTVDAAQFQSRLNDFDYDLVLSRWVNSLSPGNEQAVYWGSLAADTKGSRNYAGVKSKVVDALIQKITGAETREELILATHALDRTLLWGAYMIPLFYRGADWFAVWPNVLMPEKTPLYGVVVESWWSKDAVKN